MRTHVHNARARAILQARSRSSSRRRRGCGSPTGSTRRASGLRRWSRPRRLRPASRTRRWTSGCGRARTSRDGACTSRARETTATTGTLHPRAGGLEARPRHFPWACSARSRRAGRPACLEVASRQHRSSAARPPQTVPPGPGMPTRSPRGAPAQTPCPASAPRLELWHFEHPGGRWMPQRTGAGPMRTPITSQTSLHLCRMERGD